MAIRRMFSKEIVGTDAFLDMPISAQALFFHLGMEGDDDGFVKNPKTVMRMIGAKADDMNILVARGFIIPFQSGVIAIRHWRILNTLRNDRYHPTSCMAERECLQLVDNVYVERGAADDRQSTPSGIPTDGHMTDNGMTLVNQMEPEHNITEHNITEHNITEQNKRVVSGKPKRTPSRKRYGSYANVLLSDDELEKLKAEFPNDWKSRIENLSGYIASKGDKYKSHLATIRNWAKNDAEKTARPPNVAHNYQQHQYTEADFADVYYNPERDFL